MNKQKKIDIILPNRIGDSILTIPMLIALKQLIIKNGLNYDVNVISSNDLTVVFKSMDIFPVKRMSIFQKIKSQVFPSDIAIFLFASSKNLFYKAKTIMSETNESKKYLKYDIGFPFFYFKETEKHIPKNFLDYFKNKYGFSTITIIYLAVLEKLGFSFGEIMEVFDYSIDTVTFNWNFDKIKAPQIKDKYIVMCTEAANGKKTDRDRVLDKQNYIDIAKQVFEKYGYKSVLVGTDKSKDFSGYEFIIDYRKKLSLPKCAKLFSNALAYVGNDTGPLHIANLFKIPSVGIYQREETILHYSPVNAQLNKQVYKPQSADEILAAFDNFI